MEGSVFVTEDIAVLTGNESVFVAKVMYPHPRFLQDAHYLLSATPNHMRYM